MFEVDGEDLLGKISLVMHLEAGSLVIPRNNGPVSLLLHHFPCLLYEIWNRTFPHSSKKYNHIAPSKTQNLKPQIS